MRVCIAAVVAAWSLVALPTGSGPRARAQPRPATAPEYRSWRTGARLTARACPGQSARSRLSRSAVLEGAEPYMLYLAWDATRLRDGRIVIANVGTDELRVFDARESTSRPGAGEEKARRIPGSLVRRAVAG